MALFIPHSPLARLLGSQMIETEASTVGALLDELEQQIPPHQRDKMLGVAVLVNGVAIHRLNGRDTPLSAADQVWMVLPSGGG